MELWSSSKHASHWAKQRPKTFPLCRWLPSATRQCPKPRLQPALQHPPKYADVCVLSRSSRQVKWCVTTMMQHRQSSIRPTSATGNLTQYKWATSNWSYHSEFAWHTVSHTNWGLEVWLSVSGQSLELPALLHPQSQYVASLAAFTGLSSWQLIHHHVVIVHVKHADMLCGYNPKISPLTWPYKAVSKQGVPRHTAQCIIKCLALVLFGCMLTIGVVNKTICIFVQSIAFSLTANMPTTSTTGNAVRCEETVERSLEVCLPARHVRWYLHGCCVLSNMVHVL